MKSDFKDTLNHLSSQLQDLKNKGISVEPLNDLVEKLQTQAKDILAIEKRIESVQRAVIEPIKKELDENRIAGKFSKFGFYLGAFGILVTAISLIFNTRFLQESRTLSLLGKDVVFMNDMPDAATDSLSLAYADFSRGYTIVDRLGIRVLRDPYTAKPYVKYYAVKRIGGDVSNYEAIKLLKLSA